jgi:hypothetical protein
MPYRETMALFANEYHEGTGPSTGRISSVIRAGNLPAKQRLRKCRDLLQILQWTQKDFRRAAVVQSNAQRGETNGNATTVRQKAKCGHPCKDSDNKSKKPHTYLENANGTLVSMEQIVEMSHEVCMIWQTLDEDGMAPIMFSQISLKAWEYYSHTILADKAFEFLLFCDDREWKLREWSMRSYPSWHCNQFNQTEDNVPASQTTSESIN